jgi:hypothetical protein
MKKISLKKLPLITILVAVVLAIGLILFVGKYSKKTALSQLSFWSKEVTIESQNQDNDNDGLRDWEEDLYKTDPNNPDTDGDGYSDGEEINSGRNPLVKAPGDEVTFYPLPLGEKYNITKKALKDEQLEKLIESYLTQKDEYLKDHPELTNPTQFLTLTDKSTLQEMSQRAIYENFEDLMGNAESALSDLPEIFNIEIADKDIKINTDNSKQVIESYVSQASDFLNSEAFFFKEKTFQILMNTFRTKDPSELQDIIKLNDAKIEAIKELTVPSSWKEIHKEGLRIIILTRNIFVSLRDLEDDPLKALAAGEKLGGLFDDLSVLINKAIELAKSQGIQLNF